MGESLSYLAGASSIFIDFIAGYRHGVEVFKVTGILGRHLDWSQDQALRLVSSSNVPGVPEFRTAILSSRLVSSSNVPDCYLELQTFTKILS